MASSPSQHAAQRRHPVTPFNRSLLSAAVLATIIGAAPPATGQETRPGAPATLIYGIVRVEPKQATRYEWYTGEWMIVENIDTRQKWDVKLETGGGPYAVFRLAGLNPGRYRIFVEGPKFDAEVYSDDGTKNVEKIRIHDYTARVVLQEYRPVFLDIVMRWIVPGSTPREERGLTMPLTDTCRADRSAPLGEGADSWGELWGVLRTPDGGNAPAGLRVNIEALGDPFLADPFITQTRTTDTGCYGVHGLMPGRYRVFVDEPPFVFEGEIQVPARESGGATRRDGELTTPPERAAGQPLRVGWYSRLRFLYSYYPDLLVEAVERAELAANINDPDDLAHVNGAVIWQNEPNDWQQYYRVPGVTVIFEHEGTKQLYKATTDSDGSFDFYVPQGRYRMLVAHQPFATARAHSRAARRVRDPRRLQDRAWLRRVCAARGAQIRADDGDQHWSRHADR